MNWEKIKEEQPLAFKSCLLPLMPKHMVNDFEDFYLERDIEKRIITFNNDKLQFKFMMPYHRRLYDYFDKCGIFINASAIDALIIQVDEKGNKIKEINTSQHKERSSAEYEAFEVCFKIVEEILQKRLQESEVKP